MLTGGDKNSENIVHAMVITSQKIIDIMGKDLSGHFMQHKVSLVNLTPAVSYGPDAVSMVLVGKQDDIKNSLNLLKKACYEKEIGIEKIPIKSLPPVIKGYLSDMEDEVRFKKIFSFCSKEYMNYCREKKINPHPEVAENLN